MKENIKQLKKTIDDYHKLIIKAEKTGRFPEKEMTKLCDDDIVSTCIGILEKIDGGVCFQGLDYNSCGYDLSNYLFAWFDGKKVDGIVLKRLKTNPLPKLTS